MKQKLWLAVLAVTAVILLTVSTPAHDLFLKMDTYFLRPNSKATVRVLNGTFQKSEAAVARDRVQDLRLIGPGSSREALQKSLGWRDEGKITLLELTTGGPGTYLVGVSTKPREIALKAADFNSYLEHDGLPDILEDRKKTGQLGKDVRERYSKHVRTVFQVGELRTNDYEKPLNFPAEIIPQQNPYSLKSGDTLVVKCILNGRPLSDQVVIAGWESSDGKIEEFTTRTNVGGVASFKLSGAGKWYVKMIHMHRVDQPDLDYESIWATLTFEIK